MKKSRLVAVGATMVIAATLTLAGAQSASANAQTSYCTAHLYTREFESKTVPNEGLYCQMQAGPAENFGYTGPVNGTMGTNSWLGVQKYLKEYWGYTSTPSGSPGSGTYKAMQRAGNALASSGNTVTVNGKMTLKAWQNWALTIETNYFDD